VFEALIDDERKTNAFGLQETRVEHLSGPDSMVVGVK
jgi:hypothetical protein